MEALKKLIGEESELVSIYYGEDTDEESAKKLCDKIKESFSGVDVELQYGGQAVYYYIISVE